MKKKCPRCSNENLKEDYKYCPICGLKLGTALEVPVQGQYVGKCKYCGKENKINFPKSLKPKFCMECGKAIFYQNNQLL